MSLILDDKAANEVEEALLAAKFALEQDVDGPEKNEAIRKINAALDKLRTA